MYSNSKGVQILVYFILHPSLILASIGVGLVGKLFVEKVCGTCQGEERCSGKNRPFSSSVNFIHS